MCVKYLYSDLLSDTFTVRCVPIFFIDVFFENIFTSLHKFNIFIYVLYKENNFLKNRHFVIL